MTYAATQQRQFGLAKESVRGTAEAAPTSWFPVEKDSQLVYDLEHLKDDALRGIIDEYPQIAGIKKGSGKIKMPADAQTIGEFLYSLLGSKSSAETPTITISASNKHIDFNIGGSDLDAQIATGSYIIGTTSATASTLCKAIKDALFAADATGTYTVTFSQTTKKFTIARSAGTLNIKFATGTNIANGAASTLGFAATDLTGAITYTGTTSVEFGFLHTITRDNSSISRPSYTFFMDYGNSIIKKYNLGVVSKLVLTGSVDGLVMLEADCIFKSEASGSIGSPSYPTQRYMAFNHAAVKIGGSTDTNIKSWQLTLESGSKVIRTLSASQDISDILVSGKLMGTGKFTIFFASETERNKFLANTSQSMELVLTHSDALGILNYKIDITLPKIQYEAYPFDDEEGLLAAKVDFKAVYDSSSTYLVSTAVTNQVTSY